MTGPPCPAIEDSGRIRVVTRMRHVEGESEPMKGLTLTSKGPGVELTISETWYGMHKAFPGIGTCWHDIVSVPITGRVLLEYLVWQEFSDNHRLPSHY